jgi:hypothetical protein
MDPDKWQIKRTGTSPIRVDETDSLKPKVSKPMPATKPTKKTKPAKHRMNMPNFSTSFLEITFISNYT